MTILKMFEVPITKALVNRALACKRVRSSEEEIQRIVSSIIEYLRYYNTISEFDNVVFDFKQFDQVLIPNEFSNFIIPKTVKYTPGLRQSVDLVVRDDVKLGKKSYADWIDLCHSWRGLFKKDANSDVTALASLRVDKSLADIMDRAGYIIDKESFVRYNASPFIPIILDNDVWRIIFREDYYNSDCLTIIEDYLSTVFF